MTRQTIGETLATRLEAAERAVDHALFETATLAALLPGARSEAFLSAVVGQKVFEGASGAIAALTDARARLVETHNSLAALARKLGLETLAMGPVDKPEDPPPVGGGIQPEIVNQSLPKARNAC